MLSVDEMIKSKNINPYKVNIRSNTAKWITAAVLYDITHDVKVPFSIPEFPSRKIVTHIFHIDNTGVDAGVRYDMIIGHELMIQLGLKAYFGIQTL